MERRADRFQDAFDQRKIAEQAGAAIAGHDLFDRAAEIDIDDIETQILAIARGIRHYLRIGAEKLGGNGMLIRIEV